MLIISLSYAIYKMLQFFLYYDSPVEDRPLALLQSHVMRREVFLDKVRASIINEVRLMRVKT